ncbi:hypothetical protein Aeqsu_2552 [Aequorivita sublithincola DSM 14238]|uniref:Uncharacterized protein n=1 Tax=Aequorivita sublithincola (strain DSM 14238 / LMG 21431 / ACAM 643 / 9-3) TaxID=746697 RepID=I3YYE0_AEQSU|nr:hypothetical protein [Aequorivita sublithincola]AFL82008.1 hypothetical protein Aeqsu_2552 [Aequorivita sublithincola DSM 14238]
MRFLILLLILIITLTAKAQKLVLNDGLQVQYVQEAILPVSNNEYVVLKDSAAYLYKTTGVIPYKKQKLSDIYILSKVEKRLYSIDLKPQYFDQIDEESDELTTLVTYQYEINYSSIDNVKIDVFINKHGYLIPRTTVSKRFTFNENLNIEDTYTKSIYQDDHAALPSSGLIVDKNNILAVSAEGNLTLTEVKNNKVIREKKWTDFNGSISLVSSVKIENFVRVNFQRYQEGNDFSESFWSIINLKTQTFAAINLKDFNTNLNKLQEQDAAQLNSVPFFYKAENNSNIQFFVLPDNNFVWVDDESYYYGSDDLSKYATMQKEGKSYSLQAHAYIYNYASRILRAIAPQEKDKIRALAETYVRNKYKIESERCKD